MQLGVGDGGAVDLGFEQRELHGICSGARGTCGRGQV
jgi:hypothetical protein